MKIGIVTFWWSEDNYGQVLQCFALQKFLKDMGHDAFLIRYKPERTPNPLWKRALNALNPKIFINYFRLKIKNKKQNHEINNNNRYFNEFRKEFLKQTDVIYTNPSQIKENPPEADIYIVGSDQVWNYTLYDEKDIPVYFLDFGGNSIKKMSYAASWSVTTLSQDKINIISKLIKDFDYISVREKEGVKLCELCGRNDGEWVPDPTMLLDAECYRSLYNMNNIRRPSSKYLLLYMLDNENDFDIENAYHFANKKNLEVVYVTGNGVIDSKKKYYATVVEWLYLIDHAEYIITNSFHCSVFSTIFNKKYGVIKLSGTWTESNSRFDSLFNRFNIEPRYINNKDFDSLDITYTPNVIKKPLTFIERL